MYLRINVRKYELEMVLNLFSCPYVYERGNSIYVKGRKVADGKKSIIYLCTLIFKNVKIDVHIL